MLSSWSRFFSLWISPWLPEPGHIIPQKDQRGCLSPPAPGLHIQQVGPFTDARSVGMVWMAPGGTTWSSINNTIYICICVCK